MQQKCERDLAAHTLAQLLAAADYDKYKDQASKFLNYLLQAKDKPGHLSNHVVTHSLMYLLKINKIAEAFIQNRGFNYL